MDQVYLKEEWLWQEVGLKVEKRDCEREKDLGVRWDKRGWGYEGLGRAN